ncbi:MAG: P-type conjugative transfer ATPase TrbB [Acidobacteria bacterium]|nr:MAG: P-type conjugative transfer ATPase TrbB [Acidobacteriota bacterium]
MGNAARSRYLEILDAELGPELRALLDAPAITNLHLNEDGSVYVRGHGGERRENLTVSARRRLALLRTLAALDGTVVSDERPILQCRMPGRAIRVTGTLPPVSRAPMLVLRKPSERVLTLADYVEQGALTREAAAYLARAFIDHQTIVIAGPTDSGKTTLANALIAALENEQRDLRIVTIEEEIRELRVSSANAVQFLARDGVSAQELLRLALRTNPARILIGEARGAECYQWLRACNTGHPGGLLTLHANSARDVVERIADLIAEASVTPSLRRIARTLDLVVYVEHDEARGRRVVREVLEVGYTNRLTYRSPVSCVS